MRNTIYFQDVYKLHVRKTGGTCDIIMKTLTENNI